MKMVNQKITENSNILKEYLFIITKDTFRKKRK